MRKKIVDILPPKETEEREEGGFKIAEEKVRTEPIKIKIKPSLPPFKKGLISIVLVLILGGGIFCFFALPGANITVWPKTESINLETNLTVDEGALKPNFVGKIIPGEVFEKEETVTKNFPATGKSLKEQKAEGIIRVYNEFSTHDQVLLATTRFVSADGKLFRTPTRVTIPGGHYEGGKLVPGEIDIKVVADQPGPEYNIGPTTFSIPGFAGTARYTKFYAKSFQPMEGGLVEESSQVTEEDLENAEDTVTKAAKEESKSALLNEFQAENMSREYKFLDEAIKTEITETFSLARAGSAAENFNFQAKAKAKTLIFKKEDFDNFVKDFILSNISEGETFAESSVDVQINPETINLDSGKMILSLDISAKTYSDIDINNLKRALRRKSSLESKIFLENQPNITQSKIELWPFWVRTVPDNLDKINFSIKID